MQQIRLKAITLQGAIEKRPIWLLQYLKKYYMNSIINISYLGSPVIFSLTLVCFCAPHSRNKAKSCP